MTSGFSLHSLPVEPVAKPRMTQSDRWQQRPAVMRYRAFCDELRLRWNLAGLNEVPDKIELVFHLAMPKSWSKKKKQSMAGKPHQQRPDLDNLAKAFFDALLDEDSHVYKMRLSKFWAVSGHIEIITHDDGTMPDEVARRRLGL